MTAAQQPNHGNRTMRAIQSEDAKFYGWNSDATYILTSWLCDDKEGRHDEHKAALWLKQASDVLASEKARDWDESDPLGHHARCVRTFVNLLLGELDRRLDFGSTTDSQAVALNSFYDSIDFAQIAEAFIAEAMSLPSDNEDSPTGDAQ